MYSYLLCPLPGVYVFDLEQIFPIPEQDLCVLFIICNSWMKIMNLVDQLLQCCCLLGSIINGHYHPGFVMFV